jgi:fido (protein-threonine AMPylation protein)
MNDTNTTNEYTAREHEILKILFESGTLKSSEVFDVLKNHDEKVSLVTVKRALSVLQKKKAILSKGAGRSVAYEISVPGKLFVGIDASLYCVVEPDKRIGQKTYSHDLFENIPSTLFTKEELFVLEEATDTYREKSISVSDTIRKKELERLVIELAWKSSKIEGNTYTLLDTEKLLLENIPAEGHDPDEAHMILNHKDAFSYVRENTGLFKKLTRANIEDVHSLLVKDLGVGKGLRSKGVGVRGSVYRPLDTKYQIEEAVEALCEAVNRLTSPYDKAMLVLLGISYIQPFEDGNKRTSRLVADAVLLAHQCAPLSYRSVDEVEYRNAMLVFYERNSIISFRKLFIEQYLFAAENYTVV